MDTGMIKFTSDQKKAFEVIMNGADAFITGGAGTGKSYLIKAVISEMKKQGKSVIVCAPTAAAASAVGGATLHRTFGFDIGPCFTEKRGRITVRTPKVVCRADVIIIDEISMCRMDMMDAVAASVMKARSKAGRRIQLVAVGDFCQLPPVIDEDLGERTALENHYGRPVGSAFAFQAPGWRSMGFRTVVLNETVRQADSEFVRNLNLIRTGNPDAVRYFNEHASHESSPSAVSVHSYNSAVDRINMAELNRIKGKAVEFRPICSFEDAEYSAEVPESVFLKVGARVIVTTNDFGDVGEDIGARLRLYRYDRSQIFHNGMTGTVQDMGCFPDDPSKDYVVVSLENGKLCMFSRKEQFHYGYYLDEFGVVQRKVIGRVSQIPLRLGYASTIHKSQGQTYDEMNFDPKCWSSGQLYVALSRLRTIGGLHLINNIARADVLLDPVVQEFYDHLGDDGYVPSWEEPLQGDEAETDACRSSQETSMSSAADSDSKISETVFSAETENPSEPLQKAHIRAEAVKADDRPPELVKAADGAVIALNEGFDESSRTDAKKSLNCGNRKIDRKPTGDADRPSPPRGRPARYPNGSQVIRVPEELASELKWMLQIVCPKGGMNLVEVERFKTALNEMCESVSE